MLHLIYNCNASYVLRHMPKWTMHSDELSTALRLDCQYLSYDAVVGRSRWLHETGVYEARVQTCCDTRLHEQEEYVSYRKRLRENLSIPCHCVSEFTTLSPAAAAIASSMAISSRVQG